jgi:hypothetical protein
MAVIGREQRQIDACTHKPQQSQIKAARIIKCEPLLLLLYMLLGKFCTIPAAAPSDCVF